MESAMNKPFVPKNFIPPGKDSLNDEIYLVPITTKDVTEDWQVILNNADTIRKTRGAGSRSEWPYNCTLEENYKDLAWLEVCAAYKQLFCYILRDNKTGVYLGAVYLYPITLFFPEKGGQYDVDFSFWITQPVLEAGKYQEIYRTLLDWLKEKWPFDVNCVYLRNKMRLEK
jgi:hypothetical protein